MKVIEQEECNKIQVSGRGGRSPLFRQVAALEVGQGVLVEPADWKKSYPPTRISARIAKITGKKFRAGKNLSGPGWLIQRVA